MSYYRIEISDRETGEVQDYVRTTNGGRAGTPRGFVTRWVAEHFADDLQRFSGDDDKSYRVLETN